MNFEMRSIHSLRLYGMTALTALALTVGLFFTEAGSLSIDVLNLKGRDIFFRLRHSFFPPPPLAHDILIVNIDDETLRRLNLKWPYSRSIYGEALKRLKPFSPKAIGFDIIFSGNDSDPQREAAFIEALADSDDVVMASHQAADGELGPTASVRAHASGVGIVAKPRDLDGRLRRFYISFPALGAGYHSWEFELLKRGYPHRLGDFNLSRQFHFVIDYRLKLDEFSHVSLWRLLEGSVLAKEIRNKLVLVGLTAEVFHDVHETPLGLMPGIAINANSLLTLMTGNFYTPVSKQWTFLLAFLLIWFVLLTAWLRPVAVTVAGTVLISGLVLFASFLLFTVHILWDLWVVILAAFSILIMTLLVREAASLIEESRFKRQSARDSITGFFGAGSLKLRLKYELNRLFKKQMASRSGVDLSVILFELDHAQSVLSGKGKEERKKILSAVSHTIRSSVRKDEVIYHSGDFQFCVILPEASIENAVRFSEKIRSLLEDLPHLEIGEPKDKIRFTTSVGMASLRASNAKSADELLNAAQVSLNRARSMGGNRVDLPKSRQT